MEQTNTLLFLLNLYILLRKFSTLNVYFFLWATFVSKVLLLNEIEHYRVILCRLKVQNLCKLRTFIVLEPEMLRVTYFWRKILSFGLLEIINLNYIQGTFTDKKVMKYYFDSNVIWLHSFLYNSSNIYSRLYGMILFRSLWIHIYWAS